MNIEAPFVRDLHIRVPAVGTAGNDSNIAAFVAPFAGTISVVDYIPDQAINGAATNNRTLTLINTGQAGTGNTTVASLNFGNGVNAAAFDEKAVTLSATAANLVVAQGDVLSWQSLHVGTGITDPGGLVHIQISRNDATSAVTPNGPFVSPIPD